MGEDSNTISLKRGMELADADNELLCVKGVNLLSEKETLYGFKGLVSESNPVTKDAMKEAIKAAQKADIVILALGEHAYHSGEGGLDQ